VNKRGEEVKTKFKFTHNNTTEINGGITMKANNYAARDG